MYIVGASRQMKKVVDLAKIFGKSSHPVLITGESGTGKELIAQLIHMESGREKLIPVNCAAIPTELLESELFGYKKGAFTGATRDKKGLFEEANNGTLFLDEISLLPQTLQPKLLRVLQESKLRRVGSNEEININVRIIAATNINLESDPNFRTDLYYRINVLSINIPPLRERVTDIEPLIKFFIERENNKVKITKPAIEKLKAYFWPGNVRELENLIKRLVVLAEASNNKITTEILPEYIEITNKPKNLFLSIKNINDQFEVIPFHKFIKDYLENVLIACKWNVTRASQLLELNRSTLFSKLRKYNIMR